MDLALAKTGASTILPSKLKAPVPAVSDAFKTPFAQINSSSVGLYARWIGSI